MRAIGTLRERKDNPASLRTCNSHLRSVKTFTRWLWKEKRTADDALAGLSQFNEETDRRQYAARTDARGVDLPAGPRRTNATVRTSGYPVRSGRWPTGWPSARVSELKELRTLTPASFDLDTDPPTVTVAAAYSKRRRQDVQPIRPDLAELLRPWLAGRPRDERLFRLPHNTPKMFRRDLAAARRLG